MREATVLINELDKLNRLINEDQDLTTRALGKALLGKNFDTKHNDSIPTDPTELILKGGEGMALPAL